MEMAQRNKLNRKIIRASLPRLFLAGDFFLGGGGDKFEGATALLAQTNKAEQHFGVHEDYGGNHF